MKHSARESSTDQSVGKRGGGSEAAICLSSVLALSWRQHFAGAALVLPDDTWAALVSVPPSMPAAKIANTKRVAVGADPAGGVTNADYEEMDFLEPAPRPRIRVALVADAPPPSE
jgi:hypothetical protein